MQRSSNSLRMFAYQHRKRGTREPPCRILVARIRSRVFKARLCVHPSFGRWAVWLRVYPACAPEFWSMGYLVTRAPFHNARVRGSAVEEAGRPRCTRCTQSMKWKLANRYSKVAKSGEKEKKAICRGWCRGRSENDLGRKGWEGKVGSKDTGGGSQKIMQITEKRQWLCILDEGSKGGWSRK